MFRDNASASPRRNRRSSAPAVMNLEERKVMTAGFGPGAAMVMPVSMSLSSVPPAEIAPAGDAGASVRVASVGAATLPAFDQGPDDAWISIGSDAQFGPASSIALSGYVSAWPTPAAPAAPTDAGAAADPDAAIHARLNEAFAKQAADTQAIQDRSEVTPRLIAALRQAREKVASEAGEPDQALVQSFQDASRAVQESGTFTAEQQRALADAYKAALAGAGASDEAVAALFAAQDAVKAASHVTDADVATLAANQKAVQTLLDALPKPDGLDPIAYSARAYDGAGGAIEPVLLSSPNAAVDVTTTAAEPVATTDDGLIATTGVVPISATTGIAPSVVAARDPRLVAVGSLPAGADRTLGRNLPGRTMLAAVSAPGGAEDSGGSGVFTLSRRISNRVGGVGTTGVRVRQALASTSNPVAWASPNNLTGLRARGGLVGMRSARPI